MKSFKNFGRDFHLTWTHVDHDLEEKSGLMWPHLENLQHHDFDEVAPKHEMSSEEENHHLEQHRKIRRSEAYHQQLNYKHMSDIFNVPLRSSTRSGGGLILKVHHYDNDDMARSYGMDLDKIHADKISKIHDLEGATDRPSPVDMHVYRGIHTQSGIHKLAPGRTFTDHGFTGTSMSSAVAQSFAGEHDYDDVTIPHHMQGNKVLAKIHVPAGSRGHYLDIDENTPHFEHEFLLHRGTHFRVDGHSLTTSPWSQKQMHVVHMSVIGNHPKELINPYQKKQTFVQGARLSGRLSVSAVNKPQFDAADLHNKLRNGEF